MQNLLNIIFIILVSVLSITNTQATDNTPKAYTFAVFPYLSPSSMDEIYAPMALELGKIINHPVKFRTSTTHKLFLSHINDELYDIVLIQPFWYPIAVDRKSYIPVVRMKKPFVSLIVVLDNSPIKTIEDLRGKTIATPPAYVPVVHMARKALIKEGIIPGKDVTFKAFKSADSCLQQVLIGHAAACIAPPLAPAPYEKAMAIKLRTIFTTPGIPSLAVLIHSRINTAQRIAIHSALLSWHINPPTKKLLKGIQTEQFISIRNSEYDVVRDLVKSINTHAK